MSPIPSSPNTTTAIAANKLLTPQTGTLAVAPNPTGGQGLALTPNGTIPGSLNPMTLLQKIKVNPAAVVTFNHIPQNFSHLKIIWAAENNNATVEANIYLTFNGDTGSNYGYTLNEIENGAENSSTVAAGAATAIIIGVCGTINGGMYVGTIDVPIYDSAFFKRAIGTYAGQATNGRAGVAGGGWSSGAAITRLDLTAATGAFAVGSTFSLYGL